MTDRDAITLKTTPYNHRPSIHVRMIANILTTIPTHSVLILCMTIPVPANITNIIRTARPIGTPTNHNCAICQEYANLFHNNHVAISGPNMIPKHDARMAITTIYVIKTELSDWICWYAHLACKSEVMGNIKEKTGQMSAAITPVSVT